MMLPAVTFSPPKRLTPRRCAFESRPLRVEPAPFFEAKSWRSKRNIAGLLYQEAGGRGKAGQSCAGGSFRTYRQTVGENVDSRKSRRRGLPGRASALRAPCPAPRLRSGRG